MTKILSAFLISLIYTSCYSQLMTNIDVQIKIIPGTITVNGGITNLGSTTIENWGEIQLTGDFTNNTSGNIFGSTGPGIVRLSGGIQNINGSSITAFNNLIIEGTGDKFLQTDIITGSLIAPPFGPFGILELKNRNLILNSHKLTVTNSDPGAIWKSGTGFIQSETDPLAGYGEIEWIIENAPAGNLYVFPFGNAASNTYIPLEMQITSPGASSSGSFSVATYPTPSNNLPLPTGVTSLINFAGSNNADKVLDRFWIIEPSGYTTQPVSNIIFTYMDNEHSQPSNVINESNLQMQHNNGAIWSPTPAGVTNILSNSILLNGVNNYSFAWTAVDNSSPLPIELISFTAESYLNKAVNCKWITASELNNDFFTVQRSVDGLNFENVGDVNGAGNSNSILNYELQDITPHKGLSYYRLRQTDFDGTVKFSEIIAVYLRDEPVSFHIYPNPANNILFIMKDDNNLSRIDFLDITGRKVLLVHIDQYISEIDISSLSSGSYIIRMNEIQKKLVKK